MPGSWHRRPGDLGYCGGMPRALALGVLVALAILLAQGRVEAQPGQAPPAQPYPPQPYPQPYPYPQPQPQPGYGYGQPYAQQYYLLTPEERELLARGEIDAGSAVAGGAIGTFFGFGIGHAVQGRYSDMGWIFT